MTKFPVHNTITTPSMDFLRIKSSLIVIAVYAKAANMMDLYKQTKEAHDNMVRQYNEQSRPKSKSFWEQFKDNLTLNMDTNITISAQYLEDDVTFKAYYEKLKNLPQDVLLKGLKEAIAAHSNLCAKK